MNKTIVASSSLLAIAMLGASSQAQTLVPKWTSTTMGVNQTLCNGMAYNPVTGHLLANNCTVGGTPSIFRLLPSTGASAGANLPNTGITVGTIAGSGLAVASDGTIYMCNYAAAASGSLKMYSWSSETATPVNFFTSSSTIGVGSVGKCLAMYGSGNNAIFILGTTTTGMAYVYYNGTAWAAKTLTVGTQSAQSAVSILDWSPTSCHFVTKNSAASGQYCTFNPSGTSPIAVTQAAIQPTGTWVSGAGTIHDTAYDPATKLLGAHTRSLTASPFTITVDLFTFSITSGVLTTTLTNSTGVNTSAADSSNFGADAWGAGMFFVAPDQDATIATPFGIRGFDVTAFKVADPTAATISVGQNTNFSVVSGGSSLTYQWKVDKGSGAANVSGAEYSGATNATLTITGAGTNDAGTYSCLVSGVSSSTWTSAGAALTVNKLSQTISGFGPIADKNASDAPFNLSATASSGLDVVYTIVSGPATVSGNTITLTGSAGMVVVSASQAGDATYSAAPAVPDQSFNVIANQPPVAGADSVTRPDQQGTKVSFADLLSNDTDADLDPLTITDVSATSAQGGTVTTNGGYVFYTPPVGNPASDTFTYTVSDGQGGTDTGTVTVTIAPPDNSQTHNFRMIALPDGTAQLDFSGIPNQVYLIQATTNLSTPDWQPIATNTASTNGQFRYLDLDATNFSARYYRTATP